MTRSGGVVRIDHDLELEKACGLDQRAGAQAIDLFTRDLDQNAIVSLAGDHRIRNAGLGVIDAATHHFEDLRHRPLADIRLPILGQAVPEFEPCPTHALENRR